MFGMKKKYWWKIKNFDSVHQVRFTIFFLNNETLSTSVLKFWLFMSQYLDTKITVKRYSAKTFNLTFEDIMEVYIMSYNF